MLKKIEKISLLCFLTWCCSKHSLALTTPVSNIFSWSQRCSSHLSTTVFHLQLLKHDFSVRAYSSKRILFPLTLLHSGRPKLCTILAFLGAIGLTKEPILEEFYRLIKQFKFEVKCNRFNASSTIVVPVFGMVWLA